MTAQGDYQIEVFGRGDKRLPVVFLPTFQGEGDAVWRHCRKLQAKQFVLVAISGFSWNDCMTPWPSGSVFDGESGYGGRSSEWLRWLTAEVIPQVETEQAVGKRVMAGYSLAGLFALWATFQTDLFDGIVSGSGSFWYPGFMDFVRNHEMRRKPEAVYFSLGDKEHEARDPLLAGIEEMTLQLSDECLEEGINSFFQLNNGNHYNQPEWRMAKGIQWMLRALAEEK